MRKVNLIMKTAMETKEKSSVIKKLGFNKVLLLICLLGFFIRLLYFFLIAADNQLTETQIKELSNAL